MEELNLNSKKKKDTVKKTTLINVRVAFHEYLLAVSDKNKLSILDITDRIFDFVKKSGFDPNDTELKTPQEELKKLRNVFISFMRTHEKEVLLPLVQKTDVAINTLIEFMKSERGNNTRSTPTLPEVPTVQEAFKKGDFKIPSANIKTQEESNTNTNPIPKIDTSLNLQVEIQNEKLLKENKFLKEELQALLKTMSPKSFGSGYVVDISKDKFEELLSL